MFCIFLLLFLGFVRWLIVGGEGNGGLEKIFFSLVPLHRFDLFCFVFFLWFLDLVLFFGCLGGGEKILQCTFSFFS